MTALTFIAWVFLGFLITMAISILIGMGLLYIINLYNARYPLELILKTLIAVFFFTPTIFFDEYFPFVAPTGGVFLYHLGNGWLEFHWIELIPPIIGIIFSIWLINRKRKSKAKNFDAV